MKSRFLPGGAGKGSPESGNPPDASRPASRTCLEDRACCCPAQPVVRIIMPPTAERPHSVDLLLCGHHYRVSRRALAAAGASVANLPGKADAATAALLENGHRQQRTEASHTTSG